MSDSWLERGHGSEPLHLDTIFTSAVGGRPAGIDDLLEAPPAVAGTRRSSRLLVVAALWFGIVVGTSGAAWAVRDALFPSIGPSEVSVWQNPGRETTPAPGDDGSHTTAPLTPPVSVADTDTEVSPPPSVEPHGSTDEPDNSTNSGSGRDGSVHSDSTVTSVDDHGGGSRSGGGGSGSDGSGSGGGGSGGSGGSGSGGGSDG